MNICEARRIWIRDHQFDQVDQRCTECMGRLEHKDGCSVPGLIAQPPAVRHADRVNDARRKHPR